MGWGDDWGYDWGGGLDAGAPTVPEVTITPESKVRSVASYLQALWQLLPPGQALDRESQGLNLLLSGLSPEWPRVELSAAKIAPEVNPLSTVGFLAEWESFAGLPDNCANTLDETLQGRRAALVAKVASTGGQSLAYYEDVARALGYNVTCANTATPYVWQVNTTATTVQPFRAGRGRAGERLRTWGNTALECKINKIKPAHTRVLFVYT
jgi:uncharacterized protein YmfQ (DUF2313 family)